MGPADDRMIDLQDEVRAGQAVYSRRMLWAYDWLVLGFSCRWIWRCPAARMLDMYNRHVSANHLEVGVGTGYFLDRCRFPAENPQIALADLNPDCLAATSYRIARHRPESFVRNALEPFELDGRTVDSVGLNFVLHCLPGPMERKAAVFDHVARLMNPGAILFGSTLLTTGVPRNWAARRLMAIYNRKRIFSNTDDALDGLQVELARRFDETHIETVGCTALFTARKGRRA